MNNPGYWTQAMLAGLTDQELQARFVASPEFYSNAGGTDAAWIGAVYKAILGRTAEASAITFWEGRLTGGQTRLQVALQIVNGAESNTQIK